MGRGARASTGGARLSIGVGIHCGVVSFGILGEDRRMQGTVIGDTVNVAARIEGMTRRFGAGILISEAARAALGEGRAWAYRAIDEVQIRGRRTTMRVWEVLAPGAEDASDGDG